MLKNYIIKRAVNIHYVTCCRETFYSKYGYAKKGAFSLCHIYKLFFITLRKHFLILIA